jgi:hypothetical protein
MLTLTETVRAVKVRTRKTVKKAGKVETVERVRVKRERTRTTVKARKEKPQGVILYRGPSLLDGKPIVVVATALARRSKNPKTGNMVQTYILADNGETPVEAWMNGGDASICGNCPHRQAALGTCYVNVVQGPQTVYHAYQRGTYPRFNARKHLRLFRGRVIRLGTYGDPAAVPLHVWETVCGVAANWTGYTHQWRTCSREYRRFCMASVETAGQRQQALEKGYRTFRVRLADQPLEEGEFECPASEEQGKRLTCEQCRACSGAKRGGKNATPAVIFHGPRIAGNWRLRRYEQAMERTLERRPDGRIPLVTLN